MGCSHSVPSSASSLRGDVFDAIHALMELGGGNQSIQTQSLTTRFTGSITVTRTAVPVAAPAETSSTAGTAAAVDTKPLVLRIMKMLESDINRVMNDMSSEGMNSSTNAGGYSVQIVLNRIKANAAERKSYRYAMMAERMDEHERAKAEQDEMAALHRTNLKSQAQTEIAGEITETMKKQLLLEQEKKRLEALADVKAAERRMADDAELSRARVIRDVHKCENETKLAEIKAKEEEEFSKFRIRSQDGITRQTAAAAAKMELKLKLEEADAAPVLLRKADKAARLKKELEDKASEGANLMMTMNLDTEKYSIWHRLPIWFQRPLSETPGFLEVVGGQGNRLFRFYSMDDYEMPGTQYAFSQRELGRYYTSKLTKMSYITLYNTSGDVIGTIFFPHEVTSSILRAAVNPIPTISEPMTHDEIMKFWRNKGVLPAEPVPVPAPAPAPAVDDSDSGNDSDSDDDLPDLDLDLDSDAEDDSQPSALLSASEIPPIDDLVATMHVL